MAFDRSRYKAAKLSSLEEQKKIVQSAVKSGFTSFHKIEDGTNVFRIAPPHEIDSPPFRPFMSTYLECEVEKYQDGAPTGEVEVKNRRIMIASIHADTDEKRASDIIEMYIQFAKEKAEELYPKDPDQRKKYLGHINGYKADKWVPGIRPSINYVGYAWKDGVLARVELYPTMMKDLEKLNIEDFDDNEVPETDVFSDPDEGQPLRIKRSKEKGKNVYHLSKVSLSKGQSWNDFFKENRLTDAQLQEFDEKKSLKELYVDCYRKRDFEMALDGLQRFDEKHKYGIFDNDEFLQKVEDASYLYENEESGRIKSEEVAEKAESSRPKRKAATNIPDKKVKEEVPQNEENSSEESNDWSEAKLSEMKQYLRSYIEEKIDSELLEVENDTWMFPRNRKDLTDMCELADRGKLLKAHLNVQASEEDNGQDEDQQEDVQAPEGTEEVSSTATGAIDFRARLKNRGK